MYEYKMMEKIAISNERMAQALLSRRDAINLTGKSSTGRVGPLDSYSQESRVIKGLMDRVPKKILGRNPIHKSLKNYDILRQMETSGSKGDIADAAKNVDIGAIKGAFSGGAAAPKSTLSGLPWKQMAIGAGIAGGGWYLINKMRQNQKRKYQDQRRNMYPQTA